MKFRKKPIVIEAFAYGKDEEPHWFKSSKEIKVFERHCEIKTLEGVMIGKPGDYIIQGVAGEIYPCKSDIFKATYEPVGETTNG